MCEYLVNSSYLSEIFQNTPKNWLFLDLWRYLSEIRFNIRLTRASVGG